MELLEVSETSELYRTIRTMHHWTRRVVSSISELLGEDPSNSPPSRRSPGSSRSRSERSPSKSGDSPLSTSPDSALTLATKEEMDQLNFPDLICQSCSSKPRSSTFRTGWRTMVGYYFNEILNFPDCCSQTFTELVDRIAYQTDLESSEVRKALEDVMDEASEMTDCGVPGYRASSSSETTNVQIGMLNFRLTKACYQRLQRQSSNNTEILTRLFLRYYPLGPSSGFFWSIDPTIYKWLESELPILECFASPFNFNTDNWCSPFEADKIFGSKGNFFNYIEGLQVPMRLVVNPPYTHQLLERTTQAVIKYLERVEGAEALITYPCWCYLDCYSKLEEWPNSSKIELERGDYNLYDHSTGRKIVTPMPLTFYILGSKGHAVSLNTQKLQDLILEMADSHIQSQMEEISTSE